jgi:hypothetical protein
MRLDRAALFVVTGGAVLAIAAQQATPEQSTAQGGTSHLLIASSSTALQSFVWIADEASGEITLCKTTSTASMGPQYDFDCKRHRLPATE